MMKTKIIAFSMVIIAVVLIACQKTPEKEIVVAKDTERLIEKAKEENGNKLEDIKVPEANLNNSVEVPESRIVMRAEGAEGNLTINVDANVIVPKGKLPMAYMSISGYSEDEVKAYFNYLFPKEKPYVQVDFGYVTKTKSQIEEVIQYYKECISEGTIEDKTLMTEKEALEEIKKLEEELKTAPETAQKPEKQISDGSMIPYQWGSHLDNKVLWSDDVLLLDAISDRNEQITVIATNEDTKNAQSYIIYHNLNSSAPLGAEQKIDLENPAIPAVAENYLQFSFEEAKEICDNFFAAGGTKDMRIGKASIISDGGLDENGELLPANSFYYRFDYVREIDGVGVLPIGNFQIGGNTDFEVPWIYETAQLCVNNEGLFDLFWMSPTKTGEIITDNPSLKSFDEIIDIFSNMVLIEYEPQVKIYEPKEISSVNITIDITEIELGLLRVRTQNTERREGVYTPAWVFSGKEKKDYTYTSGQVYSSESSEKEALLVINAIDGSIINLEKGY